MQGLNHLFVVFKEDSGKEGDDPPVFDSSEEITRRVETHVSSIFSQALMPYKPRAARHDSKKTMKHEQSKIISVEDQDEPEQRIDGQISGDYG